MVRNPARLAAAAVGGATALTLGVAGPALACTNGDGGWSRPAAATSVLDRSAATTLADKQARLDAAIARKLAWIGEVRQRVAASDRLDATQQAAVLDRLQKAETALTELRADVAAATTLGELRDVLSSSDAARWLRWWPRHHRTADQATSWGDSDDKADGDWSGHDGDWSGHDGDWSGHDGDWSGHDGGGDGHDGDWSGHDGGGDGSWGGR